jgi:hypothetical protein
MSLKIFAKIPCTLDESIYGEKKNEYYNPNGVATRKDMVM